jgi:hypothetical protein
MKPQHSQLEAVAHSAEVVAGPLRSTRADAVTTIWRDGDVVREDLHGRARILPSITPIHDRFGGDAA